MIRLRKEMKRIKHEQYIHVLSRAVVIDDDHILLCLTHKNTT